MKKIITCTSALACLLFIISSIHSQTTIITDDGSYTTGEATAILDVKSTGKGLLIPRMTLVQRNAINSSSPATGLLIFQTDDTPGFYFNAGPPETPDWRRLSDQDTGHWMINGEDDVYYTAGRVGIGTDAPGAGLHLKGLNFPSSFMFLESGAGHDAGFRIYEGEDAKWHIFNQAGTGGLGIFNAAWHPALFVKQANGNVGLGITEPTQKLHIDGNVLIPPGKSYWIGNVGDSGNRLRMHLGGSNAYIDWGEENLTFRSGVSNSTPRVVFTGSGNVGIGTASPHEFAALDVTSTTKGFLPPRMTKEQRDAIPTPAEGLVISCTDCNLKGLHQYINGSWQALLSGSTGNYGTVVNPATGKVWLDRNLGATLVATSSTDAASYGDLYQWGRNADGHQIRTPLSGTTETQSSNYFTDHGLFIKGFSNWLSVVETHMWSGTAAENNPCPSGFRIPTAAEWEQERRTWTSNNAAGAYISPLKLPVAGFRHYSSGSLTNEDTHGSYWSSSVSGASSRFLNFYSGDAYMNGSVRASGFSVRCLKD